MSRRIKLTPAQKCSIYATSAPGGKPQINGVTAPRLATDILYVEDCIITDAPFKRPINAVSGIILPDGTITAPAITFATEPNTGLYKNAPGEVTFVTAGTPSLRATTTTTTTAPELTTFGGASLSINPAGPDIDFNGKNLVNVGAIVTDPNKIPISSGTPVDTVDDTPTTIATLTTDTNASYSFDMVISCISTFDNSSSASIRMFAKGKNIAGTVSVNNSAKHLVVIADPLLLSGGNNPIVTAIIAVSGSAIVIQAVGPVGLPIRWYATGEATRVLL